MTYSLERLQDRSYFSSLSGLVWDDRNSSTTLDESEPRFSRINVYLDTNRNGQRDPGEPVTRTNSAGRYVFTGLSAGTYDVRVEPPSGVGQVSPDVGGKLKHSFDIQINYLSEIAPSQARTIQRAVQRWEAVLVSDLPTVKTDLGKVDDLVIDVSVLSIDGGFGTLAQAEPTRFRSDSLLPSRGVMEFDRDDLDRLESEGKLLDLVIHEMAHVLGFGTLWQAKGLLADAHTTTPRFTGPRAKTAFEALFGVSSDGVPVEGQGGPGTILSHWRESALRTELMTGYSEAAGTTEPLSRITVQQFADLGYTVNPSASDTWNWSTDVVVPWKPSDAGVRPFTYRVVLPEGVDQQGIDFPLRANRNPVVTVLDITPSPVTRGDAIVLRARASDRDGDPIYGMTFYRESNGISGLQTGSDTYISTKFRSKQGAFAAETSTDGLNGPVTYYAVAVDPMLFGGRRSAQVTIYPPTTPPVRPNPVVVSSVSDTSRRLQWKDRSDNEIGFRIEVALDAGYDTILRAFNVPPDSVSALITGLSSGTDYFYRIRSYNLSGVSAYTRVGPA
jgi:hypothetical protein